MDFRAPHKKREAPALGRDEEGTWVSKGQRAEEPGPLSEYWAWRKLRDVDWGGHDLYWRPREEDLTDEENLLGVASGTSFEGQYGGPTMIAGRRAGKSLASTYSVSAVVQRATMIVDSFSEAKRWKGTPRRARRWETKECRTAAFPLGVSEVFQEEAKSGHKPRMLEARCRACGMARVVFGVGDAVRRKDGTYRIEDGLEGAVGILRARWEGMKCEEVRDTLTVLAVMKS